MTFSLIPIYADAKRTFNLKINALHNLTKYGHCCVFDRVVIRADLISDPLLDIYRDTSLLRYLFFITMATRAANKRVCSKITIFNTLRRLRFLQLTREYKAIQENPPPYIVAHPSEANILEFVSSRPVIQPQSLISRTDGTTSSLDLPQHPMLEVNTGEPSCFPPTTLLPHQLSECIPPPAASNPPRGFASAYPISILNHSIRPGKFRQF